jgi:hypothetical protein
MNTLEAFNQALFLLINGTTATPGWEISVALLIADYVIYLIPLLLAGMWLWGSEEQRRLAIRACLVAMLGVGANQLIGLVWQHPRPFDRSRPYVPAAYPGLVLSERPCDSVCRHRTDIAAGRCTIAGHDNDVGRSVGRLGAGLSRCSLPAGHVRRCRSGLRGLHADCAGLAFSGPHRDAVRHRVVPQTPSVADRPRLAAALIVTGLPMPRNQTVAAVGFDTVTT